MLRDALTALVVLGLSLTAQAGEFNKKLSVGDAAPTWTNLPGVDGKTHSLADLKDKDVVVVVFTGNACPVATSYQDRIIAFTKKYAGPDSKVALVAISVSKEEEDLLPEMKKRAREAGFNFPYLHDDSQEVGRKYGASVTPEFFVLNKERKVVYLGGMDDSLIVSKVTEHYLEPAVEATLKGDKVARPETEARGCNIRYEKKKP